MAEAKYYVNFRMRAETVREARERRAVIERLTGVEYLGTTIGLGGPPLLAKQAERLEAEEQGGAGG